MRNQNNTCDRLNGHKQLTSRAYDRWSRVWDFARYTNGGIYDASLKLLGQGHKNVLDVGCGTGLMSAKLAASGRQVLGLDISIEMVERAERRNDPKITFIHGDAEKLPSDNHSFDAVVNLISFHHYPNPSRAVAEFRRVLRPGGRLVLVAFDRNSLYTTLAQKMNRWTKGIAGSSWQKTSGEIILLLRAAGFTNIEVKPLRYWIKTFAIVAE